MTKSILVIAIALLFVGSCAKSMRTPAFGDKVRFKKDVPLNFGELKIDFKGERRVSSETFPQGFLHYDFRVTSGDEHVFVSWSSGTGDIGPVSFEVNGQKYALEMRMSDKLGRLADDEIVVWKK